MSLIKTYSTADAPASLALLALCLLDGDFELAVAFLDFNLGNNKSRFDFILDLVQELEIISRSLRRL